MSLIPEEELKRQQGINLAPMVDFLFLVIAIFATLIVARAALYNTDVDLVQAKPTKQDSKIPPFNDSYQIVLSVLESGQYKWISEFNEYLMEGAPAIQQELLSQQQNGIIPKEKSRTKILLKVDRNARWESIAQLIFAVREIGFQIYPIYENERIAADYP